MSDSARIKTTSETSRLYDECNVFYFCSLLRLSYEFRDIYPHNHSSFGPSFPYQVVLCRSFMLLPPAHVHVHHPPKRLGQYILPKTHTMVSSNTNQHAANIKVDFEADIDMEEHSIRC